MHAILGLWSYASRFLIGFITAVVAFATACLRIVPIRPALRLIHPVKLITVRLINQLKPVYRESYATHGLSLGDMPAR